MTLGKYVCNISANSLHNHFVRQHLKRDPTILLTLSLIVEIATDERVAWVETLDTTS